MVSGLAPPAQAGPVCLAPAAHRRVAACTPQLAAPSAKRQRGRLGAKPFTPQQETKLSALHGQLCKAATGSTLDASTRAQLAYQQARIYYDARRWQEAAVGFRAIAINPADIDIGSLAAQLYLDTLNLLGSKVEPRQPACFQDMATDVPKLLKLYCSGAKGSVNDQTCETLERINADIGRLKIENLVKAADRDEARGKTAAARKQYARAASAYLDLWEKHGKRACLAQQPSCKRNEEVLYNAARAFQAAGARAKAIAVRKILIDPRYHLDRTGPAVRALRELGHDHQSLGHYGAAARYLLRYANSAPKREHAAEALSDAIVLSLGLSQFEQAIAASKLYLMRYGRKRPAKAAQVAYAIGAHYVDKGKWKDADAHFKKLSRLIETHGQLEVVFGSRAQWARVKLALNKAAEAELLYARLVNDWQNPQAQLRKLRAAGASPAVFARRLGRVLIAVAEAQHFFAEQKRAALAKNKLLPYKGPGNIKAFRKYLTTTLAPWQSAQLKALRVAQAEYAKIMALRPQPPPKAVVLAAAAVADMWASYAATVRAAAGTMPAAAPASSRVARQKQYAKRLELLESASGQPTLLAKQANIRCLAYSARYQAVVGAAARCEAWLSANYPREYTKVDEIMPMPSRVNSALFEPAAPLPDPR